MPCPDLNELLDLGRGTLDGERADELARHLDLCDVCRALVAEATGGSVRTPPLAEQTAGTELDPPEMFPKLGRYVVLDLLNAGGMGVVYAAYDPQLDRKVALKLLRPESLGAETLEQAQARLLREAQAMASLSHPNVVPVFDVGTVGRQVFVAMELIDGGTLTDWLTAERRGWREVVEMFLQAGRGLAAAHAAGIVHRDFKPDNVLIGRDGRARVSDFGLARPAASDLARATGDRGAGAHESSLAGTPAYMAPEQFEGRGVSARSDQFSFCVALWEALYGRRPFAGQTAEQLAESVLSGATPSPPPGSNVPGWLQRALLRGLSRRPEDRFPFIDGLLDELSRSSVGGRRRRRLAAAAVALSIALAAAFIQLGRHLAQRCGGVGAEIGGVWSSARREALRKAFADANVPYSSGSLRTIEAALDRFAAAWSQRRRAACEAGSEEPQLRCLRRQLVDLRALLQRLESGDRAAIESGAAAASRLAFESACVGSLGLGAEEPLEVLEALARTEAALLTGATGDALALAKKGRELAARAG
ncbi:MAG: serine/threonine-protein kinase, partial [Myxococcales bacterium]